MAYTVQVPASNEAASDASEKAGTEASAEVVQRTEIDGGSHEQAAEQVRTVVAPQVLFSCGLGRESVLHGCTVNRRSRMVNRRWGVP